MKAISEEFIVSTSGKGTYEITDTVSRLIKLSGILTGTATIFIRHTSASLVIFENADPSARTDLHHYFERLAPEESEGFVHTLEGPDDMTSHLRSVLTATSQVVPIIRGRLGLGTWQGLFVFEHRRAPHERQIVVTLLGM